MLVTTLSKQMFIWIIFLGTVTLSHWVFDEIFVECWHWDLSHLSPAIVSLVIITPDFPLITDQFSPVQPRPSSWLLEVSPSPAVRRAALGPTVSPPVSPGAGLATASAVATPPPPPASTSPATSPALPAATPAWPAPTRSSWGGKPPDCPGRNTKLAASQWTLPRYMRQGRQTGAESVQ